MTRFCKGYRTAGLRVDSLCLSVLRSSFNSSMAKLDVKSSTTIIETCSVILDVREQVLKSRECHKYSAKYATRVWKPVKIAGYPLANEPRIGRLELRAPAKSVCFASRFACASKPKCCRRYNYHSSSSASHEGTRELSCERAGRD